MNTSPRAETGRGIEAPADATRGGAAAGYLPTLDGWRAIAILGVLVAHGTDYALAEGGRHALPTLHALTRHGGLGVDVFFGISGFLITTRLLEEADGRGRISLRGFYVRRVFRIFPAYFTYLAAVAVLALVSVLTLTWSEWVTSAVFMRNYVPLVSGTEGVGWYTAHLWSLAVEEHFYLLWPGLLVLWGRRRAFIGLIAAGLVIAAWRVIEFRLQLVPAILPEPPAFYVRSDIRLDAPLWGCWVALLYRIPAVRERMRRLASPAAWVALAALFAACVRFQPPLALLWQSVLIPLIVVGTVLRPAGAVARALEAAPMRWIGRLSYSLYLWQQLFFVGGQVPRPLPFGVAQTLPLSVVLVFLCAGASYYVVERPMVKLGHRLATPVTPGRI